MRRPAPSKYRRSLLIGLSLVLGCLVFANPAAAESRLYWTNNASGSIGTANRAGGDAIQKFFFASPEPHGITADSTHVYWTDEGTDEIGRAELGGGNVEPSLIPAAAEVPEGMAVDGGHIYWANLIGQSIGRARLDGSDPEPKFIQLSAASFPEGIAIEGSHIYWTASGHGGEIGRSNLTGGEVDEELIPGLGGAISALAVDSTHLYWSTVVGVGRAKLDGTAVEPNLVTGQTSVGGVAVDDEHVFWTSFTTNRIGRAELDGGNPEPSFITGAESPDTIAVSLNQTTTTGGSSKTSVNGGESVYGTATIGGGESPSGTIDFGLYGPTDPKCTGAPEETFAVTVAGNGSYTSPPVTPKAVGTYHWVAEYGGDALNASSSSTCAAGAFNVGKHVTTTLGGASAASVTIGESVRGTATIDGGDTTSGTVIFSLFGPDDATCVAVPLKTFAVTVAGNGSYTSPPVTPTAVGTYHWVAEYGGDAEGAPSSSACAAATFTVVAVPSVSSVTPPSTPATVEPAKPAPGPFVLLEVTRDRATGIGHMSFTVPSAGVLTVSGPGVKTLSTTVGAAGPFLATVAPQGSFATRLLTNGRGFTEVTVSFQPTSGPALSFTRSVRLVKKIARG